MIKYAKGSNPHLSFLKLYIATLKIIGFLDALLAGNRDFTSHFVYIIFISDKTSHAIPLIYKSYIVLRATRSVMGAELIAFSNTIVAAFTLREEFENLHSNLNVPMGLLTESKTLSDVVSKGTKTAEKRLMLDVACTPEGFQKMESNDIGFIRSNENLTDGLTEVLKQNKLLSVMSTCMLNYKVDQWIVRGTITGK